MSCSAWKIQSHWISPSNGRYRYQGIFCQFDADGFLSRVFIENSGETSELGKFYAHVVF